ncbi:hypothetical protein OH77DRAFT_1059727 [Trametes cingulata]|nr:hypothetical protein OH77DRAFT_1059727 [Trametes cingulata]
MQFAQPVSICPACGLSQQPCSSLSDDVELQAHSDTLPGEATEDRCSYREPPTPPLDDTLDAIFKADIFNLAHDDAAELLPLVDLWFELSEHLTEGTIPSPLDFREECSAIARILREARARSPHVSTPSRSEDRMSVTTEETFSDSRDCTSTHTPLTELLQPSGGLQSSSMDATVTASRATTLLSKVRVRFRVKRFTLSAWSAHPPFIPYWP